MCKIILASLGRCPQDWLQHLQPGFISSFDQLANEFVSSFSPCLLKRNHTDSLLNVKQRGEESFFSYGRCFQKAAIKITDMDRYTALRIFEKGLDKKQPRYPILDSFMLHQVQK